MTLIGIFLAVLMGVALGVLGGGGSILAVPILVYAVGFDTKEAIAASLLVVGLTSIFGAVEHWRGNCLQPRVALIFGPITAAAAYLGAHLAGFLSGAVQLSLFAIVMLLAAVFMFINGAYDVGAKKKPAPDSVGRILLRFAVPGIAVGILTGVVGVGGGFLIVPALVLLAGMTMRQAVGTSLLVIAMNSLAGFAGYLGEVDIQWGFLAIFTALAVTGSFAGAYIARFIPQRALKQSFAVFLIVMAAFILYENTGSLL